MPPASKPPTIASLKVLGVEGIIVRCNFCPGRSAHPSWADLDLPDETEFPKIGGLKRFRCDACGRPGSLMPDWSGMQEQDRQKRVGSLAP